MGTSGGTTTFDASSLPNAPAQEEREAKISGHVFLYYNVYKNEDGDFVLKDNSSYIQNKDLVFGMKFKSSFVVAYAMEDGVVSDTPMEIMEEKDGYRSYSVHYGFEICIPKDISMLYQDVCIGKIIYWC